MKKIASKKQLLESFFSSCEMLQLTAPEFQKACVELGPKILTKPRAQTTLNHEAPDLSPAVYWCCRTGEVECLRSLEQLSFDWQKPLDFRKHGNTAAVVAATHGHLEVVKWLYMSARYRPDQNQELQTTYLRIPQPDVSINGCIQAFRTRKLFLISLEKQNLDILKWLLQNHPSPVTDAETDFFLIANAGNLEAFRWYITEPEFKAVVVAHWENAAGIVADRGHLELIACFIFELAPELNLSLTAVISKILGALKEKPDTYLLRLLVANIYGLDTTAFNSQEELVSVLKTAAPKKEVYQIKQLLDAAGVSDDFTTRLKYLTSAVCQQAVASSLATTLQELESLLVVPTKHFQKRL